jgi:hypothetical protein
MTEADWIASCDPAEMLAFIWDRSSERRIRCFNYACCRRIWHLLGDERSRLAIEVFEQYDAGLCAIDQLVLATAAARDALYDTVWKRADRLTRLTGARAAFSTICEDVWPRISRDSPRIACNYAALAVAAVADDGTPGAAAYHLTKSAEKRAQVDLVRDIFGNPFRSAMLPPAVLTPTVVSLARAADDDRRLPSGELDPHRLAVLADALEEAGAPDELVAHLRTPGPHVRGCWAVDLCLGLT